MLLLASSSGAAAEDADDAAALRAVQGRWARRQQTAEGPVLIVKEHRGSATLLSALDAQGRVIYAHESEFKVERSGDVRIFTFFNRKITAGPNAGQIIKAPVRFIYRVDNHRFIEVYGALEGDPEPPRMVVWERLEKKGEDAA